MFEAAELVKTKSVSPVEVTKILLARIEQLNPLLNAFITVSAESALQEAKEAEAEIANGHWRGPLHGIPIAIKDLVDTEGVKTTAASAVLAENVPTSDSEVVRRLKAAGAISLGKLNLHEFAYGGSGMISHFGVVRNPWNTAHITGGSSSGSAAAVAARLCYGAIGTDTAGSIRLPAACCGIVGLKPTYGLVSTRGVIPLCWSYDHVGPMTRNVQDAAAMLAAIAGHDPQDLGSRDFPPVDYAVEMQTSTSSLRLGVVRDFFWDGLDREVESSMRDALAVLQGLCAEMKEVRIPVDTDRTVARCESYVYHEPFLTKRAHLYQPETLKRIRSGQDVTASAYIEKSRELQKMRRAIVSIFSQVDVLITPTVPVLPPTIDALEREPETLRPTELLMLRNTRPFNVWGLPTISVPCGFSKSGLPIGVQIAGAPGAEALVLRLAHAYEGATDWHKRRPTLRETGTLRTSNVAEGKEMPPAVPVERSTQ